MGEERYDIRHSLAVERTVYANERTLLAYIRTALTLLITGISFLGFSDSRVLQVIAWIFIPAGIAILIFGTISFYSRKKRIMREKEIVNRSLLP